MKFIDSVSVEDFEVLSDNGFIPLKNVLKTIKYDVYVVILSDCYLECADTHIVFNENDFEVYVKDLKVGDRIRTIFGVSVVLRVFKRNIKECLYDLEMQYHHKYYSNNVLSHNTTISAAFLLHQVIFNDNYQVAVLANKAETAGEILERVKLMYENLPFFLQVGVEEWNKRSIKLGNNSKIFAAATSGSSIRGRSVNCVTGDTEVIVQYEDGSEKIVTMKQMYSKDFTKSLKVLSQGNKFRSFEGMKRDVVDDIIQLFFSDQTYLYLTPEHEVFIEGNYVEAKDLKIGDEVHSTNGKKEIVYISENTKKTYVYDFINIEETNNYFANDTLIHQCLILDEFAHIQNEEEFFTSTFPVISSGKTTKIIITSTPNGMNLFYKLWHDSELEKNSFKPIQFTWRDHPDRDEEWKKQMIEISGDQKFAQEHEGDFIGSAGTLIDRHVLQRLTWREPEEIYYDGCFKIYDSTIKPDGQYIISVDVSEGIGKDYSVIVVIDVSESPFKLVSIFRKNTMVPMMLADILYEIAKKYNGYCIIESNSIGKIVADALYYDYEYEHVLLSRGKDGEVIVDFKNSTVGLRQTKKTKKIGAAQLKSLIESGLLLIPDYDTIQELFSFIRKRNSYEAEKGKYDDIVMCLVSFAWFTTQDMFEEYSEDGMKRKLIDKYIEQYEESNTAFGFLIDGSEIDDHIDEYFDPDFSKAVNQEKVMKSNFL